MRITSLSRDEGVVGDEVVIRGAGLRGDVYFNGVKAVAVESEGTLTTHVPAGAVTGPLTVAGGGEKCETQFNVMTIPHGTERGFQGIETGHQTVHRADAPKGQPPLATANPEVTTHEIPGVPVSGAAGARDEAERNKEEVTRPVHPLLHGQPQLTPAVPPGTISAPVVVSGPTDGAMPAANTTTATVQQTPTQANVHEVPSAGTKAAAPVAGTTIEKK